MYIDLLNSVCNQIAATEISAKLMSLSNDHFPNANFLNNDQSSQKMMTRLNAVSDFYLRWWDK